jgi:hypothetical protein
MLLGSCATKDDSPLGRAQRAFGPKSSVSGSNLACGDAKVFTAVPDPVPPDYDGFQALLIGPDGNPVAKGAEIPHCWKAGVRDVMTLARIAGLFVGRSQQVATEEQRDKTYIRNREAIEAPKLEGSTLTFWVVRGSMAPTAERVVVDLETGARDQ